MPRCKGRGKNKRPVRPLRKIVRWRQELSVCMKKLLKVFNWWVLAGIVALAVVLGIFNNLRVYEEQRVKWFGGPVIPMEK